MNNLFLQLFKATKLREQSAEDVCVKRGFDPFQISIKKNERVGVGHE